MHVSDLANKFQVFLWDLAFNDNTRLLQTCNKVVVMSEGCYNLITTMQYSHKVVTSL